MNSKTLTEELEKVSTYDDRDNPKMITDLVELCEKIIEYSEKLEEANKKQYDLIIKIRSIVTTHKTFSQ